jgi:hypothetical protein
MITGSHQGFFLDEKAFTPCICEEENLIKLTADPQADLSWDEEIQKAEERSGLLFWQLDLGLEKGALFLKDTSYFLSLSIALEKFSQEIWPKFKERTFGISLYKGEFDLTQRVMWDETTQELFDEYLAEHADSLAESEVKRLFFVTDLFAEFMHRLISYLPTEAAVFALFDPEKISNLALQACLFSPARFEHLHLALKHCSLPLRGLNWENGKALGGVIGKGGSQKAEGRSEEIRRALLLPQDPACSPEVLKKLNQLIMQLEEGKIPYRLIPEPLLTEEWDGIETLFIVPEAVSAQGKRMLQGFEIAGGEIRGLS